MKEQNVVLYYKVRPHSLSQEETLIKAQQLLQEHIDEMFSIVYTPTEGDAIANFSCIFRRPEGCFLNIDDQDRIEDNLAQWGSPTDFDIIVVSDGEQVTYSFPMMPKISSSSSPVPDLRHWRPRHRRYSDLGS